MSRRATRATADVLSTSTQMPTASHIAPSTAMYINSQYNHPAFNKLYLGPNLSHNGKSLGAVSAVPKPPKPPEKPLMPYMRYSRKVWDDVKASQPDLKLWEVGKIIGKMWRELSISDKQLYMDEYETEKAEYQDLLKSYYNSPAYQGYLQAKGRADAIEAENRASERDDSIMSIEPADDGTGDTDEGFSVKHVSAARFQRNHRLMQNVLLDSTIVPSSRGIVTQQRLEVLQAQVQSLQSHQKKLENELHELEKNHNVTKHKWEESTKNFVVEMKRLRNMTPYEYRNELKEKENGFMNKVENNETALDNSVTEKTESNKVIASCIPSSNATASFQSGKVPDENKSSNLHEDVTDEENLGLVDQPANKI